ncbi:3-oxoacyl-ACP reductase FabG [Youngiibacter fragilis]|uniref:3-oxoacyl-[acyl-carrier-protein] reductase n=1 Tax=Youngiibacter fragilis 232.1 TaxID=994573 RepID=V7I2D6_9CLOT|nr:3-oxoacyl-ACP reductase FabG [Youngiibacter fragilis]ETA79446.1 3-ketoacyl-ACP reductase [Youngiibacter fragilis 232.1]
MVSDIKVALVTGSGRGLGKAIALKLASDGIDIVVNDMDARTAMETADEIRALGRKVLVSGANVADTVQVEEMFEDIRECFGRLDILVNNAGITRDSTFLKMTSEEWQQVLDINLTGVFNCTKPAAIMMKDAGCGKIVNLSSISAQSGNIGQANYSATKAAVIGITKTLARELAVYNINVNAVAPGLIRTPLTDAIPDKVMARMLDSIPLKRIGKLEDIANLVRFLSSEESSYITGQVIGCNGGWYM